MRIFQLYASSGRTALMLSSLFLLHSVFCGQATAQNQAAYLINVGSETVYFATSYYKRKKTSSKHSTVSEYIKPQLITSGWKTLRPGKSAGINPEYLVHVRDNTLSPTAGTFYLPVVHGESTSIPPVRGSIFPKTRGATYISPTSNKKGTWLAFQKIKATSYKVKAGKRMFALEGKKFDFNFSSRDRKSFSKEFQVPGSVQFYREGTSKWSAESKWTTYRDSVKVTGHTEGKNTGGNKFLEKVRLGKLSTGRDEGYYRGSVTVYYTKKVGKEQSYMVRESSSGKVYGPVSHEKLSDWFNDGRINSRYEIKPYSASDGKADSGGIITGSSWVPSDYFRSRFMK